MRTLHNPQLNEFLTILVARNRMIPVPTLRDSVPGLTSCYFNVFIFYELQNFKRNKSRVKVASRLTLLILIGRFLYVKTLGGFSHKLFKDK